MSTQKKNPSQDNGSLSTNLGLVVLGGLGLWILFRGAGRTLQTLWEKHPWLFVSTLGVLIILAVGVGIAVFWNHRVDRNYEESITAPEEKAVLLGSDEKRKQVFLKQRFRTMHTQVIGTTSAGKTESIILPWAIHDVECGSGLLIIDGKSDSSFLDKLYGYVCKTGREKSFRLLSLAHVDQSHTFNPLVGGGPAEIVERVFSSFHFENEYYRNIQYKIFLLLIRLIQSRKIAPTFLLVHRLLTDTELLAQWASDCKDEILRFELQNFLKVSPKERSEKISGLETHLSHFAIGEYSTLFNSTEPQIQFDDVLSKGLICYFQLPSMYLPFLAEATGKLVLQSFQNAVSKRHLSREKKDQFFSCFLDDFQDYIYPGFGALLNKSRSANIGVVFSHQAIGDLNKVSPDFTNVVLTNTNVKCVMRTNDPETSDYFARSFGTRKSEKVTERRQQSFLGHTKTGDGSVREVDEYIIHPNEIRNQGTGQGVVTIPHAKGVKVMRVAFQRREDIAPVSVPLVQKILPNTSEWLKPIGTDTENSHQNSSIAATVTI